MLIGTKCTKVSKRAVRDILAGVLETLFNSQAALAKKDGETTRLVEGYESLCYWDARERFDPFVEYVAKELGEVTTGWFWPEPPKKDNSVLGDFISSGMADFYHKEIMEKITRFCNGIREYYEGTPLAGTWNKYDKAMRRAMETYRKLYESGEGYIYGYTTSPASCEKKAEKE